MQIDLFHTVLSSSRVLAVQSLFISIFRLKAISIIITIFRIIFIISTYSIFHCFKGETMQDSGYRSRRPSSVASSMLALTQTLNNIRRDVRSQTVSESDNVRTVTIKTPASNNLYKGGFTYLPNKEPRSCKYDKVNCSHGTLHFKDYTPISSLVAKTGMQWVSRSTWQDFFNIGSTFNQRRPVNGSAVTAGLSQFRTDRYNVEVVWQKMIHTVSNRNKHGVTVEFYDLIAKADTMGDDTMSTTFGLFPENHPWGVLQQDVNQQGKLGTNTSTFFAKSLSGIDDIEMLPSKAYSFRQQWGICNKTVVDLGPGDQYTHTTFHKKHFIIDNNKANVRGWDGGAGFTTIKGVTTGTMVRAYGRVGHNATTSTIDGTYLDTVTKYQVYLRECMPYMDYFTFDASADWNGEGGLRTTVSVMEENNPTDTAGT